MKRTTIIGHTLVSPIRVRVRVTVAVAVRGPQSAVRSRSHRIMAETKPAFCAPSILWENKNIVYIYILSECEYGLWKMVLSRRDLKLCIVKRKDRCLKINYKNRVFGKNFDECSLRACPLAANCARIICYLQLCRHSKMTGLNIALVYWLKDVVTPYTHISEASRYILYTIILTFDGICTLSWSWVKMWSLNDMARFSTAQRKTACSEMTQYRDVLTGSRGKSRRSRRRFLLKQTQSQLSLGSQSDE